MSLLKEFYAQLDICNAAAPADEPAHEAAIWERFGIERTVLVLDMAGFSVKVQKHGLMYFLRKIRYMQSVIAPLLRQHHGELVKFEADNAYAVFPRPADAIACALDTHDAFRTLADGSPDVDHLEVSIGLARGRILLIPGHDFFGDAVNLASKLGEDVADASETWIAADLFADTLALPGVAVEPTTLTLSGIEIPAGQIRRTAVG